MGKKLGEISLKGEKEMDWGKLKDIFKNNKELETPPESSNKIIVEDLTSEKKEVTQTTFEEGYVKGYVMTALPVMLQDGIVHGLSTKEIVYAMYLIGECLKQYTLEMDISADEFIGINEWAEKLGKEYIKILKNSDVIERAKEALKKIKDENIKS
jgi:hypothetical protein